MSINQSIAAVTNALVHPAALQSGPETARHQTFLLRTLAIVFLALAAAPLFLAFHGAPSASDAGIFCLALAPVGAVMLVSKTGRLAPGHLICALCMAGVGVTLALTPAFGPGSAFVWLILAQMECLLAFDNRLTSWAVVASIVIFAALAVLGVWSQTVPAHDAIGASILAGVALMTGAFNAVSFGMFRRVSQAAESARGDRLQTIAATIDDIVISFDANGTADYVSDESEIQVGLPPHVLLGRGLFEHVHVADRPAFLTAIADAAHGTARVKTCVRLRTMDRHQKHGSALDQVFLWIEVRARRLDRAGSAPGVIALLRNVTGTKQAAGDLEDARLSAEAATQSRDQFLANMSHELRTPLNAIIGFSEVLGNSSLRPAEPAKQIEYAGIIHQSGQHLLSVVNSILDMSKLQSGTFSITPEHFDIGPLIDSCCEMVTLKALEGRVEVVRSVWPGIEPVVGDRRACKQVLINLLSNAVKFTPENGRVTISAKPEGNSLLICVSDTGIGIGATDLSRLGNPFFQAKSSLDRPYEGTGLGLSVVRGLVGLHGGTISIESEPGHGTSVTVRLPMDCRQATTSNTSATIETFAQRRRPERIVPPQQDETVKKIA